MSLAEELLKIEVPSERVTVLGHTFIVKGMSLNDKGAMLARCRRKADGMLDGAKLDREMLANCVTVEKDGSKLTGEQWGQVPTHITAPLIASGVELLGFDEDDIKRVKRDPKDSSSTES